jgi:hypothetical protein
MLPPGEVTSARANGPHMPVRPPLSGGHPPRTTLTEVAGALIALAGGRAG